LSSEKKREWPPSFENLNETKKNENPKPPYTFYTWKYYIEYSKEYIKIKLLNKNNKFKNNNSSVISVVSDIKILKILLRLKKRKIRNHLPLLTLKKYRIIRLNKNKNKSTNRKDKREGRRRKEDEM